MPRVHLLLGSLLLLSVTSAHVVAAADRAWLGSSDLPVPVAGVTDGLPPEPRPGGGCVVRLPAATATLDGVPAPVDVRVALGRWTYAELAPSTPGVTPQSRDAWSEPLCEALRAHPSQRVLLAVDAPLRLPWRAADGAAAHHTAFATATPTRAGPRGLRLRAVLPATARSRAASSLVSGHRHAVALARALVLGDRRALPPALREAFRATGTAHLLAISGLHVGALAWLLWRLALLASVSLARARAQIGRPDRWAAAVTGAGLVGASALVTPSDATRRAALVLALVLLARGAGRRPRGLRLLAVAAAAVAVAWPRAFLGPSAQLSFAAAAALVVGAPALARLVTAADPDPVLGPLTWAERALRRLRRALAGSVGVTVVCHLATAPLALAWFGQLAPIGLAINLVATPWVALIALPAAVVWLVVGAVVPSVEPWVGPALAWPLEHLAGHLCAWADLAGPPRSPGWPLVAGLLGSATVVVAMAAWSQASRGREPRLVRGLALASSGLAAVSLCVVAVGAPVTPSSGSLIVQAVDVGHGDALAVRLPDGRGLLVDAGGSPFAPEAGARHASTRVLDVLDDLGVRRLAALIVTHADADHLGGARRLAERLPVDSLWVGICDVGHPGVRALAAVVAERGGRVVVAHAGGGDSQRPVAVLWPPTDLVDGQGRCRHGRNDGGLVLRLSHAGRRVLLAADIEAPAEAALLTRAGAAALRADVLKVPHHGSRSSSTPAFLDAVAPQLALVSGRRKAGRMPPHADVLTRYQRRGIRTLITGDGDPARVTVHADGRVTVGPPLGR